MTSLLDRLILCLAIVSQLMLGTGRGMVLCVESDGSVQFEVASVSCCEPEAIHDLHGEAEQAACASEEPGCGGCSDQSLQILESPRAKHTLPPLVALYPGLASPASPSDRAAHFRPAARPPVEPRLACLRSVVLRC